MLVEGLSEGREASAGVASDLVKTATMSPAQLVVGGQLLAEAAYKELSHELNSYGIDHLLLKGPHLGAAIYGDSSQRPYGDLDVLVPAQQFDEAVAALAGCGFSPKGPLAGRSATWASAYNQQHVSPHGWLVELHRELAPHGQYSIDYRGLFSRAEAFRIGRVWARGLSTEDLLLHLVIHAAKTAFADIEPKHVEDVAVIVARRGVRWDVFGERSRSAGCSVASWVLFSAAVKIHGAQIPEDVLSQYRPTALRRWWLGVWFTQEQFPIFRRPGFPAALRRVLVSPGVIDSFWHGIGCGCRYTILRFRDLIGRRGVTGQCH
jgi:hypothetical protein